jgi:hypothetical protein
MKYWTSQVGYFGVEGEYMAFPAAFYCAHRNFWPTPPNPLPCHACHGNKITSAHHEEVGASADGPVSAPSESPAAMPPA